jgi:hypothetical protein
MPESTGPYERPLRQVFWLGDRDLAVRVARVCVLFEDLRVEYFGATVDRPLPLDALNIRYRRLYFLRRSLVTLDEFYGALSRLNAVKEWKTFIDTHPDAELRKRWADAIVFFSENKGRFAAIRNNIGGHYLENAAAWAVNHLRPKTKGTLIIETSGTGADAKLDFATELVASVLLKDLPNQSPSDDEWAEYVSGIFRAVTEGWSHAVKAVHVVIAAYLAPRFRDA